MRSSAGAICVPGAIMGVPLLTYSSRISRNVKRSPAWNFHDWGVAGDDATDRRFWKFLGRRAGSRLHDWCGAACKMKTLNQTMAELGHSFVDVLKMDVEGVEDEVLASLDWSLLCVGLLLVELHAGGKDFTIGRVLQHIRALESAGFMHYSSEVVCGA